MRIARVSITQELILSVDAFPFPAGTRIVAANMSVDGRDVEFVMQHQDLPEVAENQQAPVAVPSFKRNVPVEFVDWGLRK